MGRLHRSLMPTWDKPRSFEEHLANGEKDVSRFEKELQQTIQGFVKNGILTAQTREAHFKNMRDFISGQRRRTTMCEIPLSTTRSRFNSSATRAKMRKDKQYDSNGNTMETNAVMNRGRGGCGGRGGRGRGRGRGNGGDAPTYNNGGGYQQSSGKGRGKGRGKGKGGGTPKGGSTSRKGKGKGKSSAQCYKCGKTGHMAQDC